MPNAMELGIKPDAILPGQENPQAAIGRDNRVRRRQQHHRDVVLDGGMAGEAVDADIMHADDAAAQQDRRRDHPQQRRLADETKDSDTPTTSAQIRNETMVGSTR